MAEKEIKALGFQKVKTYTRDVFTTNRYKKGVMEVEFTYRGFTLETVDLTMVEINCMPIALCQIVKLDSVLGSFEN